MHFFVPLKFNLTYGHLLTTCSEEGAKKNKADWRKLADLPCLDLRTVDTNVDVNMFLDVKNINVASLCVDFVSWEIIFCISSSLQNES